MRLAPALLLSLATGAGLVRSAHAYEAEASASSSVQFYSLTGPWGEPELRRRRYTSQLSLRVVNIGDPAPDAARWSFQSSVRLDADFGIEPVEQTELERFVPGLRQAPLDIMYAYLEGRRVFGEALGLRIGRQYVIDPLGFWSFDGVLVGVSTPFYVRFELLGGFEQRGGLPMLSTSRFEADGVLRGDRAGLETQEAPYYLESKALAPAYGVSVAATELDWLAARVSYRKVITRDTVLTTQFADAQGGFDVYGEDRTSSERAGAQLTLRARELGTIEGRAVYDAYVDELSQYDVALDWYASERATVGVSYDYILPVFDADSIFNWFDHEAISSALLRTRLRFSRRLELSTASGARWFRADDEEGGNSPESLHDFVARAALRFDLSRSVLELRSHLEAGERGRSAGSDLRLTRSFGGGFYDSLLLLSLYDWHDPLRPTRDATSFTYVLGAGMRPFPATRVGAEWEHTTNELVGQRFRVLATLEVEVGL